MENPNWSRILEVLYEEEDGIYREIQGELSDSHKLVTESGLDADGVEDSLAFLRVQGLIEQTGVGQKVTERRDVVSTHIEYQLTQKGFEVAHERELRQRQQKLIEKQNNATNTLADFTIILGATALIQALAAVVSAPRYSAGLGVVYLILLVVMWYKSEDWFMRA